MRITEWKDPALTWNGTVPEDGRASILEIRSDQFIPDFLQAMGGKDPADYFNKHRIDEAAPSSGFLKLYQPLHGCFYLVTASLVCRQLGLPNKGVNRSGGESVFFVIRRRAAGGKEEAWIPLDKGGYWKSLTAETAMTVAPGEERLPMHPVKICPKPETPHSVFTDNVERDLYYGYIPTGKRDKYKDTVGRIIPAGTDPAAFNNNFFADAEVEYGDDGYSFRQDVFLRRVFLPWKSRLEQQDVGATVFKLKVAIGTNAQEEQLYLIVELGNFLKSYMPTFWTALKAGNDASLPQQMKFLYDLLANDLKVKSDGTLKPFREVILKYENNFPLVRGLGEMPSGINLNLLDTVRVIPGPNNDVTDSLENLKTLQAFVYNALEEETKPFQLSEEENLGLAALISSQVQPKPKPGEEPLYQIRVVYEYDPDCPPVVSPLATRPFQLTKFFEPDAPARLVRLEAPSMKPKDLRKFARGVGIEMSPELHKTVSCLGGDDVQGVIDSVGSCDDGGLSIQMICSFSIQIIFLVAFIVMFIFLISLNFIFGWLAYLRICLPIPTKSS